MHFPGEEVAFPLESSTPQGLHEVNGKSDFFRIWFRVPKHRAYLIDYRGSSTSVDLNSLLRLLIPSCPLVVGVTLDLDVASPWRHTTYWNSGAADQAKRSLSTRAQSALLDPALSFWLILGCQKWICKCQKRKLNQKRLVSSWLSWPELE